MAPDLRGWPRHQVLVRPLVGHRNLLDLHQHFPARYPFLLQSSAHGSAQGRYDILLAADRQQVLELPAAASGRQSRLFLQRFARWARDEKSLPLAPDPDLPFTGGWFVFLGYEMAGAVEPILDLPPAPPGFPQALAVRCPAAIIYDHRRRACFAVAESGAKGKLGQMQSDWGAACCADPAAAIDAQIEEEPPEQFVAAVNRVKDYIAAGDIFQANISRLWTLQLKASAAELYARLCHTNPAPFAGLANWGDAAVISSSPERLVQAVGGYAQTRPIAGTYPRGASELKDRKARAALLKHPKERAEHVMLIDLERNDLGRVCMPGTVRVDEFMVTESYAHVHHIVSGVSGNLRPLTGPSDVIAALFPGGTITGCPKVRCMQIIAQMEGQGRGPYTGSMGYVNRSGDLDLNICIRTLHWQPGQATLRAGAGIVADSDPRRELEETRAKARGILRAVDAMAAVA